MSISSALAFLWVGCGGAPPKPELMQRLTKEEITVAELRAVDYEFAALFGQLVARCAEEILRTSDDRQTRQRALSWRIFAAPQARAAAFNQDPMAGLIGLWVLAAQQRRYFTDGGGKGSFDRDYDCVADTVIELEREAEDVAARAMPPERFGATKPRVDDWVAQHPIEGDLSVHPSAQADLAALVGGHGTGGLQAVGSIDDTVKDLNSRIAILSVQLPTEARWQADYLVRALFEEYGAEQLKTVADSLTAISAFFDTFETILVSQTKRILDAFSAERDAILESVETERALLVDALDAQRVAVFDSLDSQMEEMLNRFEETGQGLIDHFFERLIGVLIGIGIFLFLMVAILAMALRRRPRGTPPAEHGDSNTDGN